MGELRDYWVVMNPNMKGHCKSVKKGEFAAHFIPLNPLNDLNEFATDTLYVPSN
jgi:hypothetical protein